MTSSEQFGKVDQRTIDAFHQMWDAFPGMARLIDGSHNVIAANQTAADRGFVPGTCCAKVGFPEIHKGCKLARTLREQVALTDNPSGSAVRGWMPVEGHDDLVVHFTLPVPQG